jgi:hypothetical protein
MFQQRNNIAPKVDVSSLPCVGNKPSAGGALYLLDYDTIKID